MSQRTRQSALVRSGDEMARSRSKGTCSFCSGIYAKSAMSRHLKACPARKKEIEEDGGEVLSRGRQDIVIHLQVEGQYLPEYWLHIEVPGKATLKDLDSFLRGIWLECCGHMSNFYINGDSFASEVSMPGESGMDVPLENVVGPGMKFEYIYDFGASTELLLKVVSGRRGSTPRGSVRLMARNQPPDIRCDSCGRPAAWICCECSDEDRGRLCEECAETHECGEDMLVPQVNSPRAGMCDYWGD